MTAVDDDDVETSEWQKRIEGEWHGRPGLFDAEGNHVGFERVDRASVVEDGVSRYWMNTKLEGARPAAQPLRARRALRLRHRRLRREPGLLRPRLLRHRPALRAVRRGQLLLAGLAGRPAHLEPGAARRRDPGLLLGAARRLGRLRGLQRHLQAHVRPRDQPGDAEVRRRLDRAGDPARLARRRCCRPRRRAPGPARSSSNAGRPERRRQGRRRHRARPALAAPRAPAGHLERCASSAATASSGSATAPAPSTKARRSSATPRRTAARSSPASTSSARTPAASRRSAAARSSSTPTPASSPSSGSSSAARPPRTSCTACSPGRSA